MFFTHAKKTGTRKCNFTAYLASPLTTTEYWKLVPATFQSIHIAIDGSGEQQYILKEWHCLWSSSCKPQIICCIACPKDICPPLRLGLHTSVIRNSPSMSLTSTDILFFATVVNWVLKYLNVSLSTVVMVSSQEEIEAPSKVWQSWN